MKQNIFVALVFGWAVLFPNSSQAQPIAYPDMQVEAPTHEISIGNPTPSTRELRFSHISWNSGAGPLVIRPAYNPNTGVAQAHQRLYTYDAAGKLVTVKDTPIVLPMVFVPPAYYRFPLSQFALYADVNGSVGPLVAVSPKIVYCIGDSFIVTTLPKTPPTYGYRNCYNPSGVLGISVGWGDKYDYLDDGNNIPITTLADGVYWLRSIADPFHYLQESDLSNNITDTQLRIIGNTVAVLQQTRPDSTPPGVTITAPQAGANVSGLVTLSAKVTRAEVVKFLVDGIPLPGTVTANPPLYSTTWNTTGAVGQHLISAQVTSEATGFIRTAIPVSVTIAKQIGTFVLDQKVTANGNGTTRTTPAFSTSAPNELLIALVGSDGPSFTQSQWLTVTGAGLNWTLVARANSQPGAAEIWAATASSKLTNVTVTSTARSPGYDQSLTVLALRGAAGIGASKAAGAPTGGPAVSVTTTGGGSWVVGVGNDWDQAIARTLPSNQQLLSQWVDTLVGDTFWSQATNNTIPNKGTAVTLNVTAPTTDKWNFAAAEVGAIGGVPPPDTTPPTVNILNPVAGQTLSGKVTLAVNATDDTAVSGVQFAIDGVPLAGPVIASPPQYSIQWDTTSSSNATHTLSVTATDPAGHSNSPPATVSTIIQNPAPTSACFIIDATASARGTSTVTTPAFRTGLPGELILAFVASDGPITGGQTATVTGAGLTWTLVKRANAQAGTSEVWVANAAAALTNATVTAKGTKPGYDLLLYVVAIQGHEGIGASAAASASSGPPTVSLQTTKPGSLIYGVGNDWDRAVARTPGPNQIMDHQWVDTRVGDTFWVQNETYPPLIPAGATVTLNDIAPTNDRWNFVAVEILGEMD